MHQHKIVVAPLLTGRGAPACAFTESNKTIDNREQMYPPFGYRPFAVRSWP